MIKSEFLQALREELLGLNEEDVNGSVDYYAEMIDDRVEGGMSENEAVSSLGEPKSIAREIKLGMPIGKLVRNRLGKGKAERRRNLCAWELVLLILGSPIWLSILIALLATVIGIYAAVWSVAVTLWALDATAIGMTLGFTVIFFVTVASNPWSAVLYLGSAMVALSMIFPIFYVSQLVTKLLVKASAAILRGIKSLII